MRRVFIGFGFVVFLVYCWASVVYQNQVDVPDYKTVAIDLLGGVDRTEWDAHPQEQFQRLMELDGGRYQLPLDAVVVGRDGKPISPRRPLTSDEFAWFIEQAGDGPATMTLRDPAALYRLLAQNYRLRDSIVDPGNPDGEPLYVGGVPLTKEMLDSLRLRNIGIITVSGHGAPVSFQPGTALMIAVIFLTLVAALKPVVWDPFLHMLERRRRELEIGAEAERQNQLEAARFDEEKRRRNGDLGRQIQELRLKGQREAALEAGKVLGEAREQEKTVKLAGLRAIAGEADRAEAQLREEIPELAEAIAASLTPGSGGAKREQPADKRQE